MDFAAQDHHKKLLDNFILTESCIIAEIYRLSSYLPVDFVDPMHSKFTRIIIDFSYFENKLLLEKFIDGSEVLNIIFNNYSNLISFKRNIEYCYLVVNFKKSFKIS